MKYRNFFKGAVAGVMLLALCSCTPNETNNKVSETSVTQQSESIIVENNVVDNTLTENTTVETSEFFTNRDLLQQPDLNNAENLTLTSGNNTTITQEGTYIITGTYSDSMIVIEAGDEDKVQLVLDNLNVTNRDKPIIYIKDADKVFVTSTGSNSLSVTGTYKADGDTNLDAVIFSRSDIVLNGTGSLHIVSEKGNGISTKDDLKITGSNINIVSDADGLEANDSIRIAGGEISITAGSDALHSENDDDPQSGYIYISGGTLNIEAGDDGIRGTSTVTFDGGEINIAKSTEGIEATQIIINDGTFDIYSTDDGINATAKTTGMDVKIEVFNGDITVEVGSGDTDAFDANGKIYIYGGNIDVTGNSSFDADNGTEYLGGTVTINGEVVSEIPQGRAGKGTKKNR